jgi:hypothetical protein
VNEALSLIMPGGMSSANFTCCIGFMYRFSVKVSG